MYSVTDKAITFFYYSDSSSTKIPCIATVMLDKITAWFVYADDDGRHICMDHGGGTFRMTENGLNRDVFREMLKYVQSMNKECPVWMEYGSYLTNTTEGKQ